MIKFSIITVCFNAAAEIRNTIESVRSQTYENLEYVIIDGGSSDGTLGIIKEYAQKDPRIRYISEKDEGLYDAMNKGLSLSSGDVIEFLNAGDTFCSGDTLAKAGRAFEDDGDIPDIVYGNIIYVHEDGSEEKRIYGKSCAGAIYYSTGDCINHQAIFAKSDCFGQNAFDKTSYKICADRDWMMRMTRAKKKWKALGFEVVKYKLTEDSISVRDKKQLRLEERKCLKRHYPYMYPVYLIFDFGRNNAFTAKVLHALYKMLYIK